MAMKLLLVLTIFALTDCHINDHHSGNIPTDSSKVVENAVVKPDKENFENTEIVCDTVYKDKGYKLTLSAFDTTNEDETITNTLFTLSKLANGHYLPIYSDSIFNKLQEIHFSDFNNDKVKDILVQGISDVRRIRRTIYI
jgi:hypothetical protein